MSDVAHSRAFARTIAEIQNGNLDRPRLLERLALALGLCTLLGGLVLIGLILWGSIERQVLPPLLVQIALSGLVAVGTFWLVRKGSYKPATQIFFYGFVLSISVAIYT